MYLTAVIDWYSRYVLSWRLSNTLDGAFCIEALEEALAIGEPEIFNTDQGVQFTSLAFTSCLESRGVAISMDGRGRALDNVFVERLWRTVKYEEVYMKDYEDAWQAEQRWPATSSSTASGGSTRRWDIARRPRCTDGQQPSEKFGAQIPVEAGLKGSIQRKANHNRTTAAARDP